MRKTLIVLVAVALSFACSKRERAAATTPAKSPAAQQAPAQSAPAAPESAGDTSVGAKMPAYSAATFDGKSFDIAGERGNVVLLNLWATWCPPCRAEIPELQRMHNQYSSQGFKVVGVSLDDSGPDNVKQFVASHNMTYPILLDPDGKLANIFQTSVVPTSVLIDRNGRIVWKQFGAIESGDPSLQKALKEALAEKRG